MKLHHDITVILLNVALNKHRHNHLETFEKNHIYQHDQIKSQFCSCCSIINLMSSVVYIIVCPFLFATALSVLRFTASDNPFGICANMLASSVIDPRSGKLKTLKLVIVASSLINHAAFCNKCSWLGIRIMLPNHVTWNDLIYHTNNLAIPLLNNIYIITQISNLQLTMCF